MNQANVDALVTLADDLPHYSAGDLVEIANWIAWDDTDEPLSAEGKARLIIPLVFKLIAPDLAARGVLAPSSLTVADLSTACENVDRNNILDAPGGRGQIGDCGSHRRKARQHLVSGNGSSGAFLPWRSL